MLVKLCKGKDIFQIFPEKREKSFNVKNNSLNTIQDDEYFITVIVSPSKEKSERMATLISSNCLIKIDSQGGYEMPFKNTKLILYPSWPNSDTKEKIPTVKIDALLIYIEEKEEINEIVKLIESEYHCPIRLVISSNEQALDWGEQFTSSHVYILNASIPDYESAYQKDIFRILDELDQEEYKKIISILKKYDDNNSGELEKKEISKLISELNTSHTYENFSDALLALDINHDDIIQYQEFLQWWKIGRHNVDALSNIYQLNNILNTTINQLFNCEELKNEISNNKINLLKNSKTMTNNISINFLPQNNIQFYKTRLCFKIATGNIQHELALATKNYLSRYTNNFNSSDSNWLELSFFLKPLTITGLEVKEFLENFRHNLIKQTSNLLKSPRLESFIKDFCIFKFFAQESSAEIQFKFKSDVYNLIKYALSDIIEIRNWLTNNCKNNMEFDFKIYSSEDLGEFIKKGKSLGEFINSSEIFLNSSCIKERLKFLIKNLNEKYKPFHEFLQLLCIPSSMKLNYKGNINEFSTNNDNTNNFNEIFYKLNFESLSPLIDLLKLIMDQNLRKSVNRMEIALNMYDIFIHFQIFSDLIWN